MFALHTIQEMRESAVAVFDSDTVGGRVSVLNDAQIGRQIYTIIDVDLHRLAPSQRYSLQVHARGDMRAPKCLGERIGPTVAAWRNAQPSRETGKRTAFSNALVGQLCSDAAGNLRAAFLIDQRHEKLALCALFGRTLALHDCIGGIVDCEPIGRADRSITLGRLLQQQRLINVARLT